jgi:anti-sigma-K factor RskA
MDMEQHELDSLPAYSLGILDGEDERRVTAHLRHCPACATELETYQAVAGQLILGAPDVQPSPRLKAAILEQIQPSPRPADRQGEKPATVSGRSVPWWERWGEFFRRTAPAWGVASLALVLVLAVSNLLLLREVQRQAGLVNHFQIVSLVGTDAAPEAKGVLVISPDGRYGTLVVDGLPRLAQGKQYQLWLVKDQQRTNGGLISVGYSGYGALEVETKMALDQFTRFGITIEPEGGSPAPTGARVLGGGS